MNTEKYFSPSVIAHDPTEGSAGKLTGYVTKFNQLSSDRGGYKVRFLPNSFSNLANEGYSVKALRDHSDVYLGRTDNGTLELSQDEVGLKFSLDLPDTTDGRDTAVLVARGDLLGMSFGFAPGKFVWTGSKAEPVKEYSAGNLTEVSVVFDPAFQNTSVSLHSLNEPNPEDLEQLKEFLGTPALNYAKRQLELSKIRIHRA